MVVIDCERALVGKFVAGLQTEALMGKGIEVEHFETKAHQGIYTFCTAHVRQYRTPPSFEAVRAKFPDYGFDVTNDALEFLVDEFVKKTKRRIAIEELRLLGKVIDDPDRVGQVDEFWAESARRLMQVVPSASTSRFSDMYKRIEAYRKMLKTGVIPGIPMGIPQFDLRTLGIQRHELVTIAGWQGTGKTTLGMFTSFNAYLVGRTPMIISLEMEGDALLRKMDVLATNLEYHAMKAIKLAEGDITQWENWAARAQMASNDIIIIDDMRKCTVDSVHGAMVRYQPDIVLVDYVSLMDAPKSASGSMWEKITHITGGLKQSARTLGIPIIAISQTNKDSYQAGADLSNISYSRSIGQDSDLVFGLHQTPDMREAKQMEVRMLKNRDGQRTDVILHWDMAHMRFREWTPADTFGKPGV